MRMTIVMALAAMLLLGCLGSLGGGYGPAYQRTPSGSPPFAPMGYGFPAYSAVDPLALAVPPAPPNVCFLYRPPPWCEGPRCLPVTNETGNHLQFRIDGVPINIPETGGFLPPGETCWLIADGVGSHHAEADGYTGPPPMQRVASCGRQFWIDATGRGHRGLSFIEIECQTVSPQSASR